MSGKQDDKTAGNPPTIEIGIADLDNLDKSAQAPAISTDLEEEGGMTLTVRDTHLPTISITNPKKPAGFAIDLENGDKPADPIESGVLSAENNNQLESGVNADESNKGKFLYPLKTNKFELQNFFNSKSFEKYQKDAPFGEFLKDYLMPLSELTGSADKPNYHLKYNSAQALIQRMPFDMYFEFRNYQAQNIKNQLERLNLDEDDKTDELKQAKWKLFNKTFPFAKPFTTANFEERKAYFKQLRELYKDVSIEVDPKDSQKAYIKQGVKPNDKTLVSITTDHTVNGNSHLNNMILTINPSLKGAELDHAIRLMMDQSTRQQERSMDNQLEISGYHNKPEVALRIYQLAILERSRPEIHPATLEAWKKKVEAFKDSDPKRSAEFQRALDFHDKFKTLATKPLFRNTLSKWINLKIELKNVTLGDYLKQHGKGPEASPPKEPSMQVTKSRP